MKVSYIRVSSTSQSLEVQRDAVKSVGVEKIFSEISKFWISRSKLGEELPVRKSSGVYPSFFTFAKTVNRSEGFFLGSLNRPANPNLDIFVAFSEGTKKVRSGGIVRFPITFFWFVFFCFNLFKKIIRFSFSIFNVSDRG